MSSNIGPKFSDQKSNEIFMNSEKSNNSLFVAKMMKEVKFVDDTMILQIKKIVFDAVPNLVHDKVIKNPERFAVLDIGNKEKKNILAMPSEIKIALEQMKRQIEKDQSRIIKIKVNFITEERKIVKNENNEDVIEKRIVKEETLEDVELISHEDSDNSYSKAIAALVSNIKFQFKLINENDQNSPSEIGPNVESKKIKLSGSNITPISTKDYTSTLIESPLGKKAFLDVLAMLEKKQTKFEKKAIEKVFIEGKDAEERNKAKRKKAKKDKVEKINKQDENTELKHTENLKWDNELLNANQRNEKGRRGIGT